MNLMGLFVPFIGAFLVLLVLSRLIAGDADAGRKAQEMEGGSLEFLPNRRSYWGVYVFLAGMGYGMVTSLWRGIGATVNLVPAVFCLAFVLLLLMAFPGSIRADSQGLSQTYWLRGEKRIAWGGVLTIAINEKKGEIQITGKGGVKVVYARQLPDRERLLDELKKHCAAKMPGESAQKMMSGR
ncbi:MAG: hypothetical protein WCC26_08520 [Terracidiphilus sp.]